MSGAPSSATIPTAVPGSQAKDTARNQLTQLVGKMVANTGSQSDAYVTALAAITAAINAKPSA